jgi:HlyD family secretion protein
VIAASVVEKAEALYEQATAQLASAAAQEVAQASAVRSKTAQLKMAEADEDLAAANVGQKTAILSVAKVDLERTIIRSPIDGVVIDRSVSVGQTVSASLEAPTLFTIAQDLRHMLVSVSVDEADIGRIADGQRALFTVDAFRDKEFAGVVQQIQKSPLMVQNVVTYTVIVSADNPDERLLPGMTASVRIVIDDRSAVLRVPDMALRFRPANVEDAPRPPPSRLGGRGTAGTERSGTVWVVGEDGRPKAVPVVVGASDGTLSEIVRGDLTEGQEVIVGVAEPERRTATARRRPF